VTTERAYAHLDHDTIRIEVEGVTKLQVPLLHLGGVTCFGDVLVSPGLIRRCADDGRSLVFLDRWGNFKARLEGPVSGNVLLRRAQYDSSAEEARGRAIARNIVAGKIQNSRQVLVRGAREVSDAAKAAELEGGASRLAAILAKVDGAANLDYLRGLEGEAAREYFEVLDRMVLVDQEAFRMEKRSRRPPLDRMNALLSFLYTLLLNDCVAAAEGVGLPPWAATV
jgi:CRISP-associated protein Cas1